METKNQTTSCDAHPSPLTAREAELFIKTMEDTLYRVDSNGCLTYTSPAAEELTGYTLDELMGMRVTDLYMHPEKREEFIQNLTEAGGHLRNYEVELQHKKGHSVWVLINVHFYYDENNSVAGIEGLIRNISQRKEIEHALEQEREKAQITLKSIGDGVITTNIFGEIEYINPTAENICGCSLEEVKGKKIQEVYQPVSDDSNALSGNPVTQCIERQEIITIPHIRLLKHNENTEFAIRETASPIRNNDGEIIGAVLVFHDVTRLRSMSRKLAYQANHDPHTGLINRREFERRLKNALEEAQEKKVQHVLCYMDLDQFKIVNDTCGHIAGDALLQQLATTIQTLVRENDTFARLGGDEFGLLIEHCPLENGIRIAEQIRKAVQDFRFSWEEKVFGIGVSIGLLQINENCIKVSEVLSKADSACFLAKDHGRNRIHVCREDDREINQQNSDMEWSYKIKNAIEQDHFVLYKQELACINFTKEDFPDYIEILIRLKQDDTIISPMAFIPAAERYNQMQNIDRWVIRNTFKTLARLSPDQLNKKLYAINISGASLADKNFLSFVITEFEESGMPPEHICFELTETAAVSNLNYAKRFMQILKGTGCSFALDDFGSGLSSFNYLKVLPVNYLKIDGGFVREVHKDTVSQAMVESINNVGHVMGLHTIAEYVENEEILNRLKAINVDFAQGFAVDKPAPL